MSEKSEANPPYRRPKLGEMSISFRSRDGSHMTSMSLVDILRAKAEAGDATAQFELGCMLLEGKRTEADPAAARSWFGKAAQAGHVRAKVNLGVIYERGMGVEADDREALSWYEAAAADGDLRGLYNAGVLLCAGRGCQQDLDKAAHYWGKAALRGHAPSQANLAQYHIHPDNPENDPATAYIWASISKDAVPESQELFDKIDAAIDDEIRALLSGEIERIRRLIRPDPQG